MFGEDTNRVNVIEAAIISLTTKAARQLRKEGLLATSATITLRTNRYKPDYKRLSETTHFNVPTADPGLIGAALVKAAAHMSSHGTWLHQASVLMQGLVPKDRLQLGLIDQKPQV